MKGQISRDSFRPSQRYSGVFQLQGAMVTDADLGEKSRITKDQTDKLGNDAIRDGVPETGGAVAIAAGDLPELLQGVVYADGVRGLLTAADGATVDGPLDLFTNQADLPKGPDLPMDRQVIYADIWQRPVFALEDGYLADPGLHGAETAFRTRTMTQLKAIELPDAPGDDSDLTAELVESAIAGLPRIGAAEVRINAHSPETLIDECDPCAEVVSATQAISNALWRLEVIALDGSPDSPTGLTLAWSIENGAAIAPADIEHEAFERANKVYEFFSVTTESHRGVFAEPTDACRPAFVDDLSTTPTPATDHGGGAWPFVRRWDGCAVVDLGAANATTLGGGFTVSVAGDQIEIAVDAFTATLDLTAAAVVAGDYWLVELRSFAAEADRIRLVQATPIGIEHHYCTLFATRDQKRLPLSDSQVRKLSFPTLADLPATHVGFDNNCPKLYNDAENVQEALDELCSISADDIAFDPQVCPELYGSADNVQDALAGLCDIDLSNDLLSPSLHDWGVVCGIVPRLVGENSRNIFIGGGSFLDRSGRHASFQSTTVDLADLPSSQVHFVDNNALRDALRDGEVCLALAANQDQVSIHLVPKDQAFGPADPSYAERVRSCIENKRPIPVEERFTTLDSQHRAVAEKMFLVVNKRSSFGGSAKMTTGEASYAGAINQQLLADYRASASEQEISALEADWQAIADEIGLDPAQGETQEIRLMQLHSRQMGAMFERDQDRVLRCLCDMLFPSCPPALGDPPFLVPIACLRGSFDIEILIDEVCPFCCRKQAMTWRAVQYFLGDWRSRFGEVLAGFCCGSRDEDSKPGERTGFKYQPEHYMDLDLPKLSDHFGLQESLVGPPPVTPSDYLTRVGVEDLSPDEAKQALFGNGVEVIEEIDLDNSEAFELIQDRTLLIDPTERLGDDGRVRPGDKVALLVQDGVVRDYVMLEHGSGKYLFESEVVAPTKSTLAPEEVERAEVLIESTESARGSLVELESRRESLADEVTKLQDEIDSLAIQRRELVESLRKNQPMQSITSDRALADKMAENGMSFVGEVKKETLDLMVAKKAITRAEADAVELTARVYIEKQL